MWAATFLSLVAVGSALSPSPVVQTRNGPIVGFRRTTKESPRDVSSFRGIPFAAPPSGQNRFRAPQPLTETWGEARQMVNFSHTCPQSAFSPFGYGTQQKSPELASEDCLYLNVYAPTDGISNKQKLPVMYWIFGGAYVTGDGGASLAPMYDGANLVARHGSVIVSANYRIASLGFWASDELRAEDPNASTGNQAMLDQRFGMQWVQDNIAGFGGDPEKVTLFGESAGGFSVFWHLVSPPSWPMFHRAIIESGTSKVNWFWQPFEHYNRDFYIQWAEHLGCPGSGAGSLPCLRKVSFWDLIDPPAHMSAGSPLYDRYADAESMPVGPTIDGSAVGLQATPLDLIRAGRFHKVPLIIGQNLDEGTIFLPLALAYTRQKAITSLPALKKALAWVFGEERVDTILAAYPDKQFRSCSFPWCNPDYALMFERMVRDVGFDCSTREVAKEWVAAGAPVWVYKFAWNPGLWKAFKTWTNGVSHGFDVPFVWRFATVLDKLKVTLADPWAVANDITCRWASFALTSSPNGGAPGCAPKSLTWPQYDSSRRYYSIGLKSSVKALRANNTYPDDEYASDFRCDMWSKMLDSEIPWPTNPKPSVSAASDDEVLVV